MRRRSQDPLAHGHNSRQPQRRKPPAPPPRPTPSTRIPAHFEPRDIRSFGHLRPTSVAPRSLAARAKATPATKPSWAATAGGQGSIIRALACRLPFGEIQARPRRPLPAVCSSATIHRWPVSPASARRRASSLVESMALNSNEAPALMRAIRPRGGGQKSDCAAAIAALVSGEGANTNRRITRAESARTMRATGVG